MDTAAATAEAPQEQTSNRDLTSQRATYSVPEAAAILGISRATAYRPGVLPTIRVGGRLLVPRTALRRMIGE